ncbi:MAG TPA: type II CAAX endopeptidase family protein [Alloacidobacterium sp.]|nr:type II CAAX endopeptidase family protein [Alloacidobacterium sp.]
MKIADPHETIKTMQEVPQRPIAPWWHTALLIAPVLLFSFLGGQRTAHQNIGQHHVLQYVLTLVWEWVLAAVVWWGIRMRGVPLRQLLGVWPTSGREWGQDLAIAAAFWIAASIVLAAIGMLLHLAHFSVPEKTLAQLAPENTVELMLWILLSVSAGICEELVFRGYLLQQFASVSRRLWVGVLASSLLFGVAHGYEGVAGIIAITAYGAMFCAPALARGSLRPGMIAHAWHDIFSGIALMVLHHSRVL